MDVILNNHDFTGIHDETIENIKETCRIFQHLSFSPDALNWNFMNIKGEMVNKPMYDYNIYPVKQGFMVKVVNKNCDIFLFGVCIFTEDGILKIWPFNNGLLIY